jgi:hypothetical protein
MIHDTVLEKSLQLSLWVLDSRRQNLERALGDDWNPDTSAELDACLELGEALVRFSEHLPTRGRSRPNLQSGLTHRPQYSGSSRRRLREKLHGFESVGSILPGVLRGIEAAAKQNRRGGPR